MERLEEDTQDKGKEIALDKALAILQREELSPKLISYFRDRVALDFNSGENHIVFARKTNLQKYPPVKLVHQSVTASSGMIGHRDLAIIYGWEKMTADSSPIFHNFWAGIYLHWDWKLHFSPLINRFLTQLDSTNAVCSISVDCNNSGMIVGEIKSSQEPWIRETSVYPSAKNLARIIHRDLERLVN